MKVKVKSRGDKRNMLIEVRSDTGEQLDYADIDRLKRGGDVLLAPDVERRGDGWIFSYTVPDFVCLNVKAQSSIGRAALERVLRSVLAACRACERERLSRRRVLFDPHFAAYDAARGKLRFAYVPLESTYAPFEVSELLIWLCSNLKASDSSAWELMERTLNYARVARVLACVDFEAFLIGCGVMASGGTTGALGAMGADDRSTTAEAPAPRGFDFVRRASQVAVIEGERRAARPEASAASVLSVVVRRVSTGERYRLVCGQYRIGRDERVEIPLSGNSSISRHHALITVTAQGMTVQDEGSANGTYVDGARIAPHVPVPVSPGGCFVLSNERFLREA